MKWLFIIMFLSVCALLNAQTPIGTFHQKYDDLSYAGGNNVFIVGLKGMHAIAACVNTVDQTFSEYEFTKPGKGVHVSSSFSFMGKDCLYEVEQIAKSSKSGLYDNLHITSWNGKDAPREFDFDQQLMASKIRYAIANDNFIYFLLDQQIPGVAEEDIYRIRHLMIRVDCKNGLLKHINYALPSNENLQFVSYWCPLRIGDNFTEWYRTKAIDNKFIYEIKRLDMDGLVISSSEITSQISTGIPESPAVSFSNSPNIFHDYDCFYREDTVNKVKAISLLAFAPLIYIEGAEKYMTTSKVTTYGENGTQGIYLMIAEEGLDLNKSYEFNDVIKNIEIVKEIPKMDNADYHVALDNNGSIYINVQYLNFRKKIIDVRNYELLGSSPEKSSSTISFDKMEGMTFPGFENESQTRKVINDVKLDLLNKAMFVCTGKGILYFIPEKKDGNIYFVKAK
jgi:hypothetical protein